MVDLSLRVDLRRDGQRQGPGGDDETRLAITLSGLGAGKGLKLVDIGCGTGASTLALAKELDAIWSECAIYCMGNAAAIYCQ